MLTKSQIMTLKQAARLGLAFLPIGLFISMFEFALPLKLESLDTGLIMIGAFISFSWIITTFLDLGWGSIIDKIGEKRSIVIGIIILAIFYTAFAFTDNIFILLLLNIFAYLGFDVFFISAEGYLIKITKKKEFNYATSGFFPIWQTAYIVGPFIAAIIISTSGFSTMFLLAFPFAIISLLLFKLLFSKQESKYKKTYAKSDIGFFIDLVKKEYLILLGIYCCTFWYSIMGIGIPLLYVIESNDIMASALVVASFALPFIFSDFLDGFIATNRKKRFLLITVGFLLGGTSLVAFFFTKTLILGMLTAFISTVGVNFAWATFEIEAGLISTKHTEGKVESAFFFAKNLGWDTSPFAFGTMAQLIGLRYPFLITGFVLIVISLVFYKYHKQIR
ncbi:MFS transporter [Candidatus Woesearchaeota archaeon]|nr:MFS transporter [Candidatus Woesearchaeota archaeon]